MCARSVKDLWRDIKLTESSKEKVHAKECLGDSELEKKQVTLETFTNPRRCPLATLIATLVACDLQLILIVGEEGLQQLLNYIKLLCH